MSSFLGQTDRPTDRLASIGRLSSKNSLFPSWGVILSNYNPDILFLRSDLSESLCIHINLLTIYFRVSKKKDPLFLTYSMLNVGTQGDKTLLPPEFYVHELKNEW